MKKTVSEDIHSWRMSSTDNGNIYQEEKQREAGRTNKQTNKNNKYNFDSNKFVLSETFKQSHSFDSQLNLSIHLKSRKE